MTRRILVWAGAVTVTLSIARRVATRRRSRTRSTEGQNHPSPPRERPTLRLVLAPLLFARLLFAFRLPGPWDDIRDAATGVANAVKNWVVDLLTSIFDFLWGWAVDIYKWVIDGFTDVWKFARDLNDWALRVVNNLVNLIAQRLQDAYNFTMANLYGLRNEVIGWLKAGAGVVVDLVGWGAQIIQDAYNLVAEKVYWPLWHLIQDVYTWINTNVLAAIPRMISDAIGAAISGLLALPQLVSNIWSWIQNVAAVAVDIVLKCWDFLVFVATHPLTWWQSYLQRIVDAAPDVILQGVANAVERNLPATEDLAVKIIGA